jgi:hypothetical protein
LSIPDALGVNPGSDLSHTGRCKLLRVPPRIAQRSEGTQRILSACSSGPGVGSSLVRLPGSQGLTSAAGTSWLARVISPRQRHTSIVNACASSRSCSVRPGPPRYGHRSWVLTGPPGFPAWPLHIFMDATGSGGNLVDECYVEVDASTRCQVRASPPTHPARWSRWDRALLNSMISALRGAEPPLLGPARVIEGPLRLRDL